MYRALRSQARPFPAWVVQLALGLILAICLVRLWLMPLWSSFWVDEMATAFVVKYGAGHPSLEIAPQVPASIYYSLPRLAQKISGFGELAYRAPSTLALLLALLFIVSIARRLIDPDAGWFAAFACLALGGFNYQAADARPYALGTCVLSASVWLLIRWLDYGRLRDALLFACAASLLWRVHLIFWPLYLFLGLYAVMRLLRVDTPVSWWKAWGVFTLLGIAQIPVLLDALSLNQQAGAHVVASIPTVRALANSLKPGLTGTVLIACALLGRWFRWPHIERAASWESVGLIFCWWLCHPVCLYAYSLLTGHSVFLDRYLFVALPGAALGATAAAAAFLPHQYWKTAAAALGTGVLLLMGEWNRPWPVHHGSNWRAAAESLNEELAGSSGVPVICPSPFIEAKAPEWRPDYPVVSFLYSHLLVYQIQGRAYPFPFAASPQTERYASDLAKQSLLPAGRFAIYGGDRNVSYWRNWLAVRPELEGWQSRSLGSFGDVAVVVFDQGKIATTDRHTANF